MEESIPRTYCTGTALDMYCTSNSRILHDDVKKVPYDVGAKVVPYSTCRAWIDLADAAGRFRAYLALLAGFALWTTKPVFVRVGTIYERVDFPPRVPLSMCVHSRLFLKLEVHRVSFLSRRR
jgi:hypothetical protein